MKYKARYTHAYRKGRFGFRKMIGRMDVRESDIDISDGRFPHYYQVDPAPQAPTISVYGNKVTLASSGATGIRYTIDGSDPSLDSGTPYSSPFAISSTVTVRAVAFFGEVLSSISSKQCEYTEMPSAPSLSQTGNTVTLTLSGVDKIYYTIDGSDPDSTKTEYSAPFEITSSCTVKAVGYKNGVKGAVLSQSVSYTEPTEDVTG